MLYLDYLASTPVLPNVLVEMDQAFKSCYANPSSTHSLGLTANEAVQAAKEYIADKIGAYPSEIIFTSGATEANNLSIKGLAFANQSKGRHIITSAIEHKCVLNICQFLETKGFTVTYLQPTNQGIITAEAVKNAITNDTILVSIMHVNNELGSISPVQEIGEVCYEHDILFHSDAAQSFCKLDIDVIDMNLAAMSVSAHKFGGPKGIGFAYIRDARTCEIEPVIHGAGQQLDIRGGTLPSPLITGLHKATEYFKFNHDELLTIRKDFLALLESKGIQFKLNCENSLVNVINIQFLDERVSNILSDSLDICVSKGSACSSREIKPSYVLTAIGLSIEEARRSFRLSFYDESLKILVRIISNDC
ncbi:cysteine desulfurase family protein [Shewanella sp. 5_MG-2023]|uniref:cysteine desulfurase family protein n=1 Tax=Shewanella sp. 5_MG-2023 TaxID=3062656 RepID=UPI0026E1B251|nr:cysteine desulfurase family protein [Shewanella sp. 5_MG-2023]MDO6639759.1 cysteine desulfurase family protein [Shewanella sp. 5_MG-2023]